MRSCSRSRTINRRKNTNRLGGYDASDLLWSQTEKIDRTNGSVKLQFKHLMSRIVVKIVKGDKFEGKLPEDIAIHIYNTVTTASVDYLLAVWRSIFTEQKMQSQFSVYPQTPLLRFWFRRI